MGNTNTEGVDLVKGNRIWWPENGSFHKYHICGVVVRITFIFQKKKTDQPKGLENLAAFETYWDSNKTTEWIVIIQFNSIF